MATRSKIFYSPHHPAGAGDNEATTRNYVSRKKFKRPISHSPDFESRHSTTRSTVCKLSPSQTDRITQEYTHSLIAWVVGKNIRSGQLARHLHHHLRLTEDLQVFELGLGYFVLKFSETDFLALEDNPWPIPNLCIYAFPWVPNFKPSEATDSSIDAWIRLHELSIEYYDEEILREIAETIGEALVKIDPITKGPPSSSSSEEKEEKEGEDSLLVASKPRNHFLSIFNFNLGRPKKNPPKDPSPNCSSSE